jgi:hypothetical protein
MGREVCHSDQELRIWVVLVEVRQVGLEGLVGLVDLEEVDIIFLLLVVVVVGLLEGLRAVLL